MSEKALFIKELILEILARVEDAESYVAMVRTCKDWRKWIKESITPYGTHGNYNINRWCRFFERMVENEKLPDGTKHGPYYSVDYEKNEVTAGYYYRGMIVWELWGDCTICDWRIYWCD